MKGTEKRMTILQIFPEIVYQENIPISSYDISNIDFNDAGFSHNDILNMNQFKKIKELIQGHVEKYTQEILEISKDLSFYITRSWIIKLEKAVNNQNFHNHSNSFFTGVLYLDIEEGQDSIVFQKKKDYHYVKYDFEKANVYNQEIINYLPKKNDLIIFDAKLLHQVGPHLSTKKRICLAFEVFAKGIFGKKNVSQMFNKGELELND
jgi:uncharacterized protein (TIGR02466 family)|tara:strand:+ start:41 stop:661 length:621 start_codon:yes stop_codon:yes gene_type:complete